MSRFSTSAVGARRGDARALFADAEATLTLVCSGARFAVGALLNAYVLGLVRTRDAGAVLAQARAERARLTRRDRFNRVAGLTRRAWDPARDGIARTEEVAGARAGLERRARRAVTARGAAMAGGSANAIQGLLAIDVIGAGAVEGNAGAAGAHGVLAYVAPKAWLAPADTTGLVEGADRLQANVVSIPV
jgi:hypothetical protein